ncbi:hypothetical protein cypCar_00032883 [Cyprinus carpio]|nr:hypothetical protein cypCar_00032883 [Cyprinus carpio]
MFPRALVLLLLCISTVLAATLIQASDDAAAVDSPADGSVLPEAQAGETPDVPANGENQAENILMADAPVEGKPAETQSSTQESEEELDWGFGSIRGSFQAVNGYFDSLLELMGGRDGVCQYRCRYGKAPQPRAGYQMPEPDGCSTSLLGFQHFCTPDKFPSWPFSPTACETFADTMYNTVWTLGCRPFMNGQRASCYCEGEEKDEL